jgi:hypothetical protein
MYMENNLKNFTFYTILCSVFMYLAGFGFILFGIMCAIFGTVGGVSLLGVKNAGPLGTLLLASMGILYAVIYGGLGVFMVILANKYNERLNRAKDLLVSGLSDMEQLTILKDLERREFWIERLSIYPTLYLSAFLLVTTVIFAPFGIILFFWTQAQKRMDSLKNNYNFNAQEADTSTRITNSTEILKEVQNKIKWEAWSYILSVIAIVVLIILVIILGIGLASMIKDSGGPYKINIPSVPSQLNE